MNFPCIQGIAGVHEGHVYAGEVGLARGSQGPQP
jgi:hypothetical protein